MRLFYERKRLCLRDYHQKYPLKGRNTLHICLNLKHVGKIIGLIKDDAYLSDLLICISSRKTGPILLSQART